MMELREQIARLIEESEESGHAYERTAQIVLSHPAIASALAIKADYDKLRFAHSIESSDEAT